MRFCQTPTGLCLNNRSKMSSPQVGRFRFLKTLTLPLQWESKTSLATSGEYSKVPILKIINFKNPGIIVWINGLERKRWVLLSTELRFPLCWNSTSLVTQQKKLSKQTLQFKPIKGIKKFFFSIILKTKWKLNCN